MRLRRRFNPHEMTCRPRPTWAASSNLRGRGTRDAALLYLSRGTPPPSTNVAMASSFICGATGRHRGRRHVYVFLPVLNITLSLGPALNDEHHGLAAKLRVTCRRVGTEVLGERLHLRPIGLGGSPRTCSPNPTVGTSATTAQAAPTPQDKRSGLALDLTQLSENAPDRNKNGSNSQII